MWPPNVSHRSQLFNDFKVQSFEGTLKLSWTGRKGLSGDRAVAHRTDLLYGLICRLYTEPVAEGLVEDLDLVQTQGVPVR